MENTENTFKVCIKCFTFNHVNYIEDAMHGFVMQQTNFPYVAVVVDDASTDGEPEVIKRFLEKEFDMASAVQDETEDYVRVVAKHKTNVNCTFVVVFLKYNHYHKKSKKPYFQKWWDDSKYIALCEGDDYWTDPLKLQKQVDFLEAHNDCVMCVNATEWDYNGEKYRWGCQYDHECDLTTDEVISNGGLYINTVSTIYREDLSSKRAQCKWWQMADVGDYPLHIAGTLYGKCHFLPDVMNVYRFQHESSWTEKYGSGNLKHIHNEIDWLSIFDKETNFKYHTAIQIHLFPNFWRALYRMDQLSLSQYIKVYKEAQRPISTSRMIKDIIRHYLKFLRK